MTDKCIDKDSKVFMHYTLRLSSDQSIADSSLDHEKPVYFHMGQDYISPAFEAALLGMKMKGKKRIALKAIDAFGEIQQQLIYPVPRDKFNHIEDLEVGSIVGFQLPGQSEEQPAVVRRLDDGLVFIDFNHPLAGQDVLFDVEIADIQ